MPTLNAATNPELANQIIDSVMSAPAPREEAMDEPEIVLPQDRTSDLPGGYVTALGEIVTEVEVRELNGRDEEIIAKSTSVIKTMQSVLERGVVRVGTEKATPALLDQLLSGDRDWLLVNIFAATFGKDLEVEPFCAACGERVSAVVDILEVPVHRLDSAYERNFTVDCKVGTVDVTLPTGKTQRAMMAVQDKSVAEMSTALLSDCVMKINGTPLFSPNLILELSIRDRRKISEEIVKRNPGPRLQDVTVPCPQCSVELEVPLSTAALFQFQ